MEEITVKLNSYQIRQIKNDRQVCASLINEGRCCEVLDLGLSVIDLHGLLITLEKAIDNQSK